MEELELKIHQSQLPTMKDYLTLLSWFCCCHNFKTRESLFGTESHKFIVTESRMVFARGLGEMDSGELLLNE